MTSLQISESIMFHFFQWQPIEAVGGTKTCKLYIVGITKKGTTSSGHNMDYIE